MGRFFSIFIIFAILIGGGVYLYGEKSKQEAELRIKEALSDARRNFADKARSAVSQDDEDYLRSIKAALRAYDESMKKDVYKEKPDWRDPAAFKTRVEKQFEEKKLNEMQRKSMLEGYEIVRDAYDKLLGANWEPILTQKAPGEVRMDIYDFARIRDDQGNNVLEFKVFFWGIEENTRVNWGNIALRYWIKRTKEIGKGRRKKTEEVEEVLGKADGDATPRFILQDPKKYIDEFPSYVSVGRIWLPVMPRESHAVDVEYSFTAKKAGAAHEAFLKWDKLPIPSRWQLSEGEAWEADVVEATEDEISGVEPDAGVEEEAAE